MAAKKKKKSKTNAKAETKGPNKTALINAQLDNNTALRPRDIIAALKKQGVAVTAAQVSTVRNKYLERLNSMNEDEEASEKALEHAERQLKTANKALVTTQSQTEGYRQGYREGYADGFKAGRESRD